MDVNNEATIKDKYSQGYLTGLRRHAMVKFTRETVLATIGATDPDDARLAGSALFAAGYNDAVDDNLKLAHDAE